MTSEFVLLMPIITIIGAGFASYVGVKVALTEMKIKQAHLEQTTKDHEKRIREIEHDHHRKVNIPVRGEE